MNDENTLDGVCTEIRCRYGRKPVATWFNTSNGKWVCYPCAISINTKAMQYQIKRPCISSKEHILALLKA